MSPIWCVEHRICILNGIKHVISAFDTTCTTNRGIGKTHMRSQSRRFTKTWFWRMCAYPAKSAASISRAPGAKEENFGDVGDRKLRVSEKLPQFRNLGSLPTLKNNVGGSSHSWQFVSVYFAYRVPECWQENHCRNSLYFLSERPPAQIGDQTLTGTGDFFTKNK